MCFPIFFLLAQFGGPFFLTDYYYQEYALPYYKWIMYFNITFAIQTSLSAFFIGTGKVKIITIATITANIVNILLDFLLIFGIKGILPSFGTKGAAIATGFAQIFQIGILLIFFLSSKNRKKYNTHHLTFKPKLLKKCLRIGAPSSIGHMIEITAWAVIMNMMAILPGNYLTIMAVGQNLFVVIAFANAGLQKAVSTVTANLIGAKNYLKVSKTWFSAVKLLLIFSAFTSLVLLIYPDPLIKAFIDKESSKENIELLLSLLKITCIFLWIYFIVDGLTWISAGILTAAGDTIFIMIMNAFGAWFFAVLPIYFFVFKNPTWPPAVWILMDFYGLMNAICFYLRYKFGKWRKMKNRVLS